MDIVLPTEVNKDLCLYELELIYSTLKDNLFFTNMSFKAIIGKKNYLTPKHGNALFSYNFRSSIANYIKEVNKR
jgi:hypothetical protein